MSGVFVSHASADAKLVDPFVDDVIRLGCGVPPAQIFHSSGEDTGIPSGENLATFVRHKVGEAGIVVAIISPTFQSRPFCLAELGAAWSKVGNLFPIAVPGLERTDLEGVLSGMLVRHLDEGAALDELHDRVGVATGHVTDATTWNRDREKWLANVEVHAAALPEFRVVTESELDELDGRLAGATDALRESEGKRRELEQKVERLADAKSREEVESILLPADEVERFQALAQEARDAVGALDAIVAEAMWYDLFDGGMEWPNQFEDSVGNEQARAARRDGTLTENLNQLLVPERDFVDIQRAYDAVVRLGEALREPTEAFDSWFRGQYGSGPHLRHKKVWDQLVG